MKRLRRTGKTSLIKVALNKVNLPHIMIYYRVFEGSAYVRRQNFINVLEKELGKLLGLQKDLIDFIRRIKGITVAGFSVKLNVRENRILLSDILTNVNDWAENNNTVFVCLFLMKLRNKPITYNSLRLR